jgi:hypothetical protein
MLGATLTFILLSLPYSVHALLVVFDKSYAPNGPEADPRLFFLYLFIEVSYPFTEVSCAGKSQFIP